MNIIEQMKDDILNGEELQYDYEIDGVNVIVITDDYPWVTILAGGNEWETYIGNEPYDGLSLEDTIDELVEFIRFENTKNTVKDALKDNGCVKDGIDCSITAFDNGATTTIQYQYQSGKMVSVTVDNQEIADHEDYIVANVAEFFINF